jgi:hypothetical protein
MRTREQIGIRLLLALGLTSAVVLFAGVGVLFATQHRENPRAPDFRVVRIGGVEYEAMQGRLLDPDNPVGRAIVAGLSSRDRRVAAGQTLFGVLIASTNDSAARRRTADRIELRDEEGHVYRPLALPVTNPYAYSQRLLRPGVRIPALGSPADDNLAATGPVLVFRIPTQAYESEALELVIPRPVASRRHRVADHLIDGVRPLVGTTITGTSLWCRT